MKHKKFLYFVCLFSINIYAIDSRYCSDNLIYDTADVLKCVRFSGEAQNVLNNKPSGKWFVDNSNLKYEFEIMKRPHIVNICKIRSFFYEN